MEVRAQTTQKNENVNENMEFQVDLTINPNDALAWRVKRNNKIIIVVNVYWLKEDFQKIIEDIHRAVVHEILHEFLGLEDEGKVETLEKLLLPTGGEGYEGQSKHHRQGSPGARG